MSPSIQHATTVGSLRQRPCPDRAVFASLGGPPNTVSTAARNVCTVGVSHGVPTADGYGYMMAAGDTERAMTYAAPNRWRSPIAWGTVTGHFEHAASRPTVTSHAAAPWQHSCLNSCSGPTRVKSMLTRTDLSAHEPIVAGARLYRAESTDRGTCPARSSTGHRTPMRRSRDAVPGGFIRDIDAGKHAAALPGRTDRAGTRSRWLVPRRGVRICSRCRYSVREVTSSVAAARARVSREQSLRREEEGRC